MSESDPKQAYRDAFGAWQKQLTALHEVLLEGKRLDPVRLKALLVRESRTKRRYDSARRRLLGIEEDSPAASDSEEEDED